MKAISNYFRHAWVVLLVGAIVLIADQFTKSLVRENLPKGVTFPVIGEWLMWQHVDNYGAAFGMFQNGSMIFAAFAVLISIGVLVYVKYVPPEKVLFLALMGLMLGGALGNLTDRFMQGFVTDFILMGIPNVFYWPNYNVADAGVVCGVIAIAIYVIWEDSRAASSTKGESAVE
jgi:signal peptidase II